MRNNATRFRFRCDTFGTAKRNNQAASLFLHNLSSILYTSDRWNRLGRWGIFFGLAPRAGAILQQAALCRVGVPAVGLIAKLLEEIALKPPYVFLRRKGMVACACSRVRLIGAWRPLALAGGVTTAVCGFGKLAENFFKKVLDRNRRSVSIVDAPFTGN